MARKVYMVPNPPMPNGGIVFDEGICTACGACIDVCPRDVLMPNPEPGLPPLVLYPDECWFCGSCVADCPVPGANELRHPLCQSVVAIWKRNGSDDVYRLGMRNPPPANTRPRVR